MGGIIFRGFLIQEVKLAGAQAGERQGGRWVVDRGVGGVGTDGLFTKGSCATGMLYISSVSWPDFPTYSGGEGRRALASRCRHANTGRADSRICKVHEIAFKIL